MIKISNINLGGVPFTIDEDAYEHLDNYLKTIHSHFRSSEGYEEITTDIEARMAELFLEKLGNRPILTLKDVTSVIAIMGTPEDFGATPLDDTADGSPKTGPGKKWRLKTGKRLFRNPDEKVVEGVCSGIAAYFGIADPIWVRLLFVLFAFTGGFAIPLYFILWAILPKAESASDKLAMRGEPINASNIGKIIEEEFDHVSKKVTELGDELKAEFGSKKKSTGSQPDDEAAGGQSNGGHHFRAAASEGVHVLGEIIKFAGTVIRKIFETFGKIFKPVAFVIGIVLVVMLALIWIAAVGGLFIGLPFSSFLRPGSGFMTTLGVINLLIFFGIPMLMITLGVMRIFMRTHFRPRWAVGLWVFWIVNLVSLMFITTSTVREFSNGGDVSMGATKNAIQADTLFIDFEKNPYHESFLRFGDDLYLSGDKLISESIRVRIEKSESGQFEIIQNNYSRGTSIEESQQLANGIAFQFKLEGNHLQLPSYFIIPKGGKWRAQQVNLTVKVPEGKWVNPGPTFSWGNFDLQVDEKHRFPWWEGGYAWKMGPDGLFNPEFAKEHEETERDLTFSNFSKIRLEGNVQLNIRQAGEYSFKFAEGGDQNDKIDISQQGDQLFISTNQEPDGVVVLEITAPNLTELWLKNSDDATLHDFDLASFRLVNEGEARVGFKANVNNLDVELTGDNELELTGNCNHLKAVLSNEARLDAGQFSVRVADVTASNDSWVKISAADTLLQHFDESSDLVSKLKTSVVIEQ